MNYHGVNYHAVIMATQWKGRHASSVEPIVTQTLQQRLNDAFRDAVNLSEELGDSIELRTREHVRLEQACQLIGIAASLLIAVEDGKSLRPRSRA